MKVSRVSFSIIACWLAAANALFGQAPTEDRVGFPEGYQDWTVLYILDRPDNKQIRTIYGNDVAASVTDGNQGNYPYGSVVVMEQWAALKDANGDAVMDKNGRFQKDPTATPTINTMRKR